MFSHWLELESKENQEQIGEISRRKQNFCKNIFSCRNQKLI